MTTTSGVEIWTEAGGTGAPTLVLLHGLGANGAVWEGLKPLVRRHWPGRWMIPDLRGHGRSGHARPYDYAIYAADVAAVLGIQDERVTVVGHSMGGVVGMALVSGWFGVTVEHVLTFGVKIAWTGEEVDQMKQLAAKPLRWFESREEAIERYLKVSGLIGLVDPTSQEAALGIRQENGRFRQAADPWIYAAAGPAVAPVYCSAQAPVQLAAGERDPMTSAVEMKALDPQCITLPGLGHSAHVKSPEAIWSLVADRC